MGTLATILYIAGAVLMAHMAADEFRGPDAMEFDSKGQRFFVRVAVIALWPLWAFYLILPNIGHVKK